MFSFPRARSSCRRDVSRTGKPYEWTWSWAVALFAVLVLTALPTAAATDPEEVVLEEVKSSRADIEAFWTEDRLREARPMPMPDREGPVFEEEEEEEAEEGDSALGTKGRRSAPGRMVPGAAPGETETFPGPYDPSTDTTLVSKWGTAPWVYSRYRVFPDNTATYTTYPHSTVGRLFFQIPGSPFFFSCSASVVNGQNLSTVLTAGHCVYSPGVGFHTRFLFVPSYWNGIAPRGIWTARAAGTTFGWQIGLLEYDVGALVMNRGGFFNNHVATDTGTLGVLFNGPQVQHYHAVAYPAAARNLAQTQPGLQFDGLHQEVCTAATAGTDLPTGGAFDPRTIGIGCDQTGGASGGPWIVNFSGFVAGQNDLVNSVVSYRYTGPNPPANLRLYGPYFGNAAFFLWAAAQGFPVP